MHSLRQKRNISERSVSALAKIVTGDSPKGQTSLSPYRSGPKLVSFFNEHFGFNDQYPSGGGFPSRWAYAEDSIRRLADAKDIFRLIEITLDPVEYIDTPFDPKVVAEYLNKYLKFDGYEVSEYGGKFKVRDLEGVGVSLEETLEVQFGHEYISQQINKCDSKIQDGDFDGAITNARSFLEAILLELERRISGVDPVNDGDLVRLYKRVQKLLNLAPDRTDVAESLVQVLRGLTSIVGGLAAIRNKMSDSHATTYRPARHHAVLAANAAKTAAIFVFESYEYQIKSGSIHPPQRADG